MMVKKPFFQYVSVYRSKSIYAKFLLFFCIIFSTFLLIVGGFSYYSYLQLFLKKAEDYNSNRLAQMRQAVDNKIEKIDSYTMSLLTRNLLQKDVDEFSLEEKLAISHDFFSQFLTEDYINNLYVYYLNSQKIVSSEGGTTDIDNFKDNGWLSQIGNPAELSIETIYLNNRSAPIGSANSKPVLSIIKKFPLIKLPVKGVIVINIDRDKLLADVKNVGLKDEHLFIIDQKGEVISGDQAYLDKLKKHKEFQDVLLFKSKASDLKENKSRLMVFQVESSRNGWKYISVQNTNDFDKEARVTINFILLLIAFSLFGGISVWFILSGRLYRPIGNLVDKVVKVVKEEDQAMKQHHNENEIDLLDKMVDNIIKNKNSYERMYKNSRGDSIRGILMNLFRGDYIDEEYLKEQLEINQLPFVPEHYAMVIFSMDSNDEMGKTLKVEKLSLLQAAINEIILENFSDRLAVFYTAYDDENLIGMCCYKEETIFITEVCDEILRDLKEKYHLNVSISIGNSYENLIDSHKSYEEASDTLNYKVFIGTGKVMHYRDLLDSDNVTLYNYPIVKVLEFMNAVKQGNKSVAISIIDEIYVNIPRTSNMVKFVSEILWQLMNGIQLSLNTMGIKLETITTKTVFECFVEFKELKNIDEMVCYIQDIVVQISDHIDEKRKNKNEKIIDLILEYIEGHYNEDLTLEGIAGKVYMSASYISLLFKENIGESLSDYIRNVRMEKAKNMLLNTNKDLNTISTLIGYDNPRSFFRVFKKYTGFTPNEYRKMNSIDKLADERSGSKEDEI